MRPILVSDVTSVARALLHVQPDHRPVLVDRIFQDADFGDRYTRRFKRVHPNFGDGTLAAAARKRRLADEPTFDDVQYGLCLKLVIAAILEKRSGFGQRSASEFRIK